MVRKISFLLLAALASIAVSAEENYASLVTNGDASIINWETSQDYPFLINNNGVAFSSNQGVGNTTSYLQGEFTVDRPYQLSFDVTASTAAVKINMFMWSTDYVIIEVDGSEIKRYGYVTFENVSVYVDKGTHSFRISYVKDESGDAEQDRGGISNIQLYERPSDFTSLSPDNSVNDYSFNSDGKWNCFEGRAESSNSGVDNSTSSFNINFNTTTARGLVFNWAVSSEENDKFEVYVDGSETAALSEGGIKSGKFSYNFEAGEHTVKLVYSKDAENAENDDKAYVTDVRLLNTPYAEVRKEMTCVAHTTFSEDLENSTLPEHPINHKTNFTFCSDGEVRIDTLMKFPEPNYRMRTLIGKVTDGNKIVFETLATNTNPNILADHVINYSNVEMWDILVTGTVSEYGLYTSSPLTFTINADTTIIKPDGVVAAMDAYKYGTQYVTNIYTDALYFIPNNKAILDCVDEITVDYVHVNGSKTVDIVITNMGDASAEISAEAEEGLTVEPESFSIGALGVRDTVKVTVVPVEVGEYSKTVTFTDGDGWIKTVTIKGEALPPLDYNDIVKEGADYITWTSSDEYPWDVIYDYAFSTNVGKDNTSSVLTANINIPEGYVATLTADVHYSCESGDVCTISKNGEVVKSLSGSFFAASGDYQLSENLVGGDAPTTIEFNYTKNASGANGDDQITLKNVVLTVVPLEENNATISSEEVDFGVICSKDVHETTVTLKNMGRTALQVLSIEGDMIFGGTAPDITAEVFEEIPVTITACVPSDEWYEGDVVINTTVGIFTVHCTALGENVIYLGDGPFPFSNYQGAYQATYPFDPTQFGYDEQTTSLYVDERLAALKDCKITSITYHMLDNYYLQETTFSDINTKWSIGSTTLDALSDGTNDEEVSGLTEVYNGEILNFVNKDLTVNFNEPYTWDGSDKMVIRFNSYGGNQGNFMYVCGGYTDYYASVLTTDGGKHSADKMIPYVKVAYTLPSAPTKLDEPNVTNAQIESVTYYDITGIAHTTPVEGINIIVTKYSDGSVSASKKLIR